MGSIPIWPEMQRDTATWKIPLVGLLGIGCRADSGQTRWGNITESRQGATSQSRRVAGEVMRKLYRLRIWYKRKAL